ncbi:hypothetical protein DM02DRAFT_653369 [Periconia macrospinosa]|uniref:Xylanolytic transcriptional activator regulatory domain-containing protein n=1 Tax=Periconia macrospinosa TaxID=97972 RepID=A0A2V1DWR8_9PLEO|nr:hypothetical protein DM02DRAFT_653369 [Periconia macrospinosa]
MTLHAIALQSGGGLRANALRCVTSNGQDCQRCAEHSYSCKIDAQGDHVSKKIALDDLANHAKLLNSTRAPSDTDTRVVNNTIPSMLQQLSSPAAPVSVSTQQLRSNSQQWSENRPSEQGNRTISPDTTAMGLTPAYDEDQRHHEFTKQNYTTTVTRSISSVTVNQEQIQQFFHAYFAHYHPLFPILPINTIPDAVYKACPFLFWTIISTAARHDNSDFTLLPSLLPALKDLLWSTVAIVPHTLPALQAMAILCVWPFPESSMPIDNTFLLAGILKSAAMHAGLHRPDVLTHYSRVRLSLRTQEIREAVRVWCCVYIAIEGIATANGHPPFITSDRIIEQASATSNPFALSKTLHQSLLIQIFYNKIHTTMSDLDRLTALVAQVPRTLLLKILEIDLQTLENQIDDELSDWTKLLFCGAALQLRGYWIFEDEETSSRRDGIIKAYETAVQFIEKKQSLSNSTKELPFIILRTSLTAAILISKVSHSSYSQTVDCARGKTAFNTCVTIFKQSCVQDNDMSGRATKVLPQLWTIHSELYHQTQRPPQINLKSRLFLSITLDGLWQWREKYSCAPNNGAPSLPPPLMSPTLTATSVRSVHGNRYSTSSSTLMHLENNANITSLQNVHDDECSPISSTLLPQTDLAVVGAPPNSVTIDMPAQDNTMGSYRNEESDSSAIQFDLLYPDTLTEFLDMSWLYEGGTEPS